MKKIPTIFMRDPANMKGVLPAHNPACEWVFDGEGVATRKYDGTCCKVEGGKLFKRREVKPGQTTPAEFVEEQLDDNTGKRVGWMPVDCNDKQDAYHCEAFTGQDDGTYELLGPKVQGNPEEMGKHVLVSHAAADIYPDCPRDMEGLKAWFADRDIEGVVFHHPDGRMAKIKKRDFGMKRN